MGKTLFFGVISGVMLAACGPHIQASQEPTPELHKTIDVPTVEITRTKTAYFGDLHIHTKNSFDAYIFNVRVTPEDAYRFGRGEVIRHGAGFDIQLAEPLDFMSVTDHGEYMGIIPAMDDPNNPLSQTQTAQNAFGDNAEDAINTFRAIGLSFVMGQPIDEIFDREYMDSVWAETVSVTDTYYEPGIFTTFSGYEFTSMRMVNLNSAANLHRNVIFENEAPKRLFSTLDSVNPEDLWAWMDELRAAGIDSLAIPHNSNVSNGWMFANETYTGGLMDAGYIKTRRANEPIVEITQVKGTSETHPMLSPNDEFADFEMYGRYIGSPEASSVNDGDFIRQSIARGLKIKDALGTNPYEFGFIGASDTHLGAGSFDEETHFGKFTLDGLPENRNSIPAGGAKTWENTAPVDARVLSAQDYGASGLAGVWAEANTREHLFEAMRRKETFATSGPRMKIRFFAGQDLTADMLDAPDLIEQSYAKGHPMGANISDANPGFIAWGIRDARSAPLQRMQIIKVWNADDGLKEAIFDVACAGNVEPNSDTRRCPDSGARVDISTCEMSGPGAGELKSYWQDPTYDKDQSAAYYVRLIENPSCRWSTWDAIRNGTPPNPDLKTTVQERAWSSPIWVER